MSNLISQRFFEMNSNPLREVMGCDLVHDGIYCTEIGDVILCERKEDKLTYLELLKKSEMKEGELISSLDEKLLNLFWRLTKNNFNRTTPYEGDSD